MKDIIVWGIHTPSGTAGLISAVIAIFAAKGGTVHRLAGKCFVFSMLILLLSGFIAALLKESINDMFLSALIIYMVFTAWLTVYHHENEAGFLEGVALAWVVSFGLVAFFVASNSSCLGNANAYFIWAGFSAFCVVGDVRNLKQGGLGGAQRLIRHVWRMGFTVLWALLALIDKLLKIQGYNVKEMPIAQTLYVVMLPAGVVAALTLYWVVIVSVGSQDRFASFGAKRG